MTAAAVVSQGRRMAESLMVDTCTIRANDAEPTYDPVTNEYTEAAGTLLYTGPCQVQVTGPSASDSTVGDQLVTVERIIVKIPVGSVAVPVSSVIEITAVDDASDPGLVGKRYRVVGSHAKTFATARRLPCELISP